MKLIKISNFVKSPQIFLFIIFGMTFPMPTSFVIGGTLAPYFMTWFILFNSFNDSHKDEMLLFWIIQILIQILVLYLLIKAIYWFMKKQKNYFQWIIVSIITVILVSLSFTEIYSYQGMGGNSKYNLKTLYEKGF